MATPICQSTQSDLRAELSAAVQKSALLGRPGFLIRRLHQIHGYLFAQETVDFLITPVQFSVMTALDEHGAMDQVTIAREVGLERTTVAAVIARIEVRGYVRRSTSATDQRVRIVKLTRQGRKLLGQMACAVEQAHHRTISPLSEEDQDHLMCLLVRLVEANNAVGNVPFRLD